MWKYPRNRSRSAVTELDLPQRCAAADGAPGTVIDNEILVALYELWLFKTNGRVMPARRDFLPGDMIRQLPHVFLIDVLDLACRFRSRLVGTGIVNCVGRDATGKMVNADNYGAAAAGMNQLFDLVCRLKRPVAKKGIVFHQRSRSWATVSALLMPLSADGANVDVIFGGMVRTGSSLRQPEPPEDDAIWLEAFADPEKGILSDPIINGLTHGERLRQIHDRASVSAA